MPFLRVNHGASSTYISLEDISVFNVGGLQKDYRERDIATLLVWTVGNDRPTIITLEIAHEAVKAFADILAETIESARSNSCKPICDIGELIKAAESRVKQEVAAHV